VMGIARDFGEAFYKATLAAGDILPREGKIFVSYNDETKHMVLPEMKKLVESGFTLVGTKGTADYLNKNSVVCDTVFKVSEGRPNILDLVKNGDVCMILNTPIGKGSRADQNSIRQVAIRYHLPLVTTPSAIKAAVEGIVRMKNDDTVTVRSIQEYHKEVK
ncbi:MAG: carbamoyl-phosphate synthase large subunit, partial [Spirochaetota bacterium]